jgi:hypothetical protein
MGTRRQRHGGRPMHLTRAANQSRHRAPLREESLSQMRGASVPFYRVEVSAGSAIAHVYQISTRCVPDEYPFHFRPRTMPIFTPRQTQYPDPLPLPYRKNYKAYPHSKIEGTGAWCEQKCASLQAVPESAERSGGRPVFSTAGAYAGEYRAPHRQGILAFRAACQTAQRPG